MMSPYRSNTFTREPADPLAPTGGAQYHVGTEAQRIMGNEVREDRHLRGCVVRSLVLSFGLLSAFRLI